jgi:Cyclin, N-terminal domain
VIVGWILSQLLDEDETMVTGVGLYLHLLGVLVDWLVEVDLKFKLVPETLYLTINLIDRYITKREVSRRPKLQLVGDTSLLIASKEGQRFANGQPFNDQSSSLSFKSGAGSK